MENSDSSRTGHYMTRVEAHLATLTHNNARYDFISREIDKWEERYGRFIATAGASLRRGDDATQPTAFDFTETIAALGSMQARYARNAA